MKVDIDSILYIAITIAILVFSTLSGRKKKKAQQMKAAAAKERDKETFEPADSESVVSRPPDSSRAVSPSATQEVRNPFDRLEQFITGQFPEIQSVEGETLEEVVDEKELSMEEIRKSREEMQEAVSREKRSKELADSEIPEEKPFLVLFENIDEVKKAIIYSEILKRKYT